MWETWGGLKEADAFQRLVLMGRLQGLIAPKCLKEADAFQRLVFATQLGLTSAAGAASKKQTPFSVWYPSMNRTAGAGRRCLKEADAFQRLVSRQHDRALVRYQSLKEADAFQRLVFTRPSPTAGGGSCLKEADAFQRLVSRTSRS